MAQIVRPMKPNSIRLTAIITPTPCHDQGE
jgi:hypothetical protein